MSFNELNQTSVAQRINDLIERMGVSRRNFAHSAGIDYSNLVTILNGHRNAGGGIISKILIAFPNINPDWLRHGEGEMFVNPNTSIINPTRSIVSVGNGNTNTYNEAPTPSPITTEEVGEVEEPEEDRHSHS